MPSLTIIEKRTIKNNKTKVVSIEIIKGEIIKRVETKTVGFIEIKKRQGVKAKIIIIQKTHLKIRIIKSEKRRIVEISKIIIKK